ncbi:hypothetical protein [Halosimplex amylolyticum]|uniref:hypothetical protein n=1 Tax=Halosimplex amylolyticum TaxID=3396616 RepID=UPI003F578F89
MSLAIRRPVSRAASFARGLVSVYRKRAVQFAAGSGASSVLASLAPAVVLPAARSVAAPPGTGGAATNFVRSGRRRRRPRHALTW